MSKLLILLVEDNLMAAKVNQLILTSLGCKIDHVVDGGEAVNKFLEKQYNAICMDIGLPTMSGVDACKAIRKHEKENKLKRTPIIAVTGNNSPEEAKEYIKVGMQAVIKKPLTKEKAEQILTFCE